MDFDFDIYARSSLVGWCEEVLCIPVSVSGFFEPVSFCYHGWRTSGASDLNLFAKSKSIYGLNDIHSLPTPLNFAFPKEHGRGIE